MVFSLELAFWVTVYSKRVDKYGDPQSNLQNGGA